MAEPNVEPEEIAKGRVSLRFLSGKCQGSEYVLDVDMKVIIGRSSDADLLLLEGMVSREHARLTVKDGKLALEDLGSTNGTFVNGEKISRRELQQGDRILIGTSILKLVRTDAPLGTVPPRPEQAAMLSEQTNDRNQMSGELNEVSVPELLELMSTTRQRGVVELTSAQGGGFITVRKGVVEDCGCDALADDTPWRKCFERMLAWSKGTFSVRPYQAPAVKRVDARIPEMLVDGLFHIDELSVLRQRLPRGDERVVMAQPLSPKLSDLAERDLDLLQLSHNLGRINAILDSALETDLEVAKGLLSLLEAGYLRRA